MKKILLIPFTLFPLIFFAQVVVVLQHNGSSSLFSTPQPFTDAYNSAANGDTIYLPGGPFVPPASFEKRLTVIGTGHYPDSTIATRITSITGNINLMANADGTVLQGLYITGNINFEYNSRIDSVVIYRCYATGIVLSGEFDLAHNCRNVLLYQNVTGSISINHSSDIRVFNNIIATLANIPSGAWIRNNKISNLQYINYSLIENNTIEAIYQNQFCTFRNNIFPFAIPADNNTWLNNYESQTFATLFITNTAWFAYSDNYHLQTATAYPGTDGSQAGIYGGYYPYKEGAVPSNPHVQSKTIPLQADVNGLINIQVKVAAQNQ